MIRLVDEIAELGKEGVLYVYPMGDNGRKIYAELKYDFSVPEVVAVDNVLSDGKNGLLTLDECVKRMAENDYLVVVSYNPDISGTIQQCVNENLISSSQIIYLYDEKKELNFPKDLLDIRDRQMLFTAHEIYKNGVKGSVAEAGVYQGLFAGKINRAFPDRKLYLFDTFEGFSKNRDDFIVDGKDTRKQWGKFEGGMANTSVEQAVSMLKYPENTVIKKGFVPSTFEGVEDIFAFVNLDMDIYEPTKEALKWFWPRLSPGGYIFVHDYDRFDGITKAIEEFSKEEKVAYFRLGDAISVAVAKPLY